MIQWTGSLFEGVNIRLALAAIFIASVFVSLMSPRLN
jgi:hypothetical protein